MLFFYFSTHIKVYFNAKVLCGPGLDGFPVECLKKGGMAMLEWLVRLLNLSFDMGVVLMDWRGACIVPVQREG